MPPLSVNVFKKFGALWVESRVCSIYLEEVSPSWNSFENKAYWNGEKICSVVCVLSEGPVKQ